MSHELKLVVSIVAKEKSDRVIEAIEKAGAIKSTIMLARGRSRNNPKLFFGMQIEPMREVIFTLVPKEKAEVIFEIAMKEGNLDKPLNGLVFIVDLEKVGGIDLSMLE
ncbi:MAG: hypothetical protein DDT21_01569 [Syntrophomonadaceae bacterium]|nr:hypothetical protein [Bacillota bacterium]